MNNTEKAGGTRYAAGKPSHFWCLPLSGLRLVARVAALGAKKYAPFDWAEGQSFSTLLDCTWRHLLEVMEKGVWARDSESDEWHVAHCAWNILCLLHFMATGQDHLDDVTTHRGLTAKDAQNGN